MSVATFGQELSNIGMAALMDLSEAERRRVLSQYELNREMSAAKGQAIGTMVGSVAGAAKGSYERRKAEVEQGQRDAQGAWQNANFKQRLTNIAAGRPEDYGMQNTPDQLQFKPYTPLQHLDALTSHFMDRGFI